MNIRNATPQDGKRLKALWLDMALELDPKGAPNPAWWEAVFMNSLRQSSIRTLVAEDQGKLVGFLQYVFFPEPSDGKKHCHGTHLYLRPEYRGKRAGFRMVEQGIADAKKNGAKVIELMCHEAQVKMWKKKGWKLGQQQMVLEI